MINLDQQQIIDLYKKGNSICKINSLFNCHSETIRRILIKNNIVLRKKKDYTKYSKTQEQQIVQLYNKGQTVIEIGKKINCNFETIRQIILRNNGKIRPKRKYLLNESFFETINSPQTAYILGLWYTDGYNCETKNYINISMCDLEILEKVKKELDYSGPIYQQKRGKTNKKIPYCLWLSSKKLSQDLAKLGCVQRKSYHLRFPTNISNDLMPHFIRGLLDGDGCIYYNKQRNQWRISITGTKELCRGIQDHLKYGNNYLQKKNNKTNHETWTWQLYNKNMNIKIFLDYIYDQSNIHLERKYQKYQEFLRWIKNENQFAA